MIRKRAIMSCIYSRSHLLIPKYYHKFKESVFFSSAMPTSTIVPSVGGWDALSYSTTT